VWATGSSIGHRGRHAAHDHPDRSHYRNGGTVIRQNRYRLYTAASSMSTRERSGRARMQATVTTAAKTMYAEIEYGVPVLCSNHVAISGAGPPAKTEAS